MKKYNVKELKSKLKNNEELKDEEYSVLIKYYKNKIIEEKFVFETNNYNETILKILTIGIIGQQMGDDAYYLPKTCSYMIATLPICRSNYEIALKDSKVASDILCRYNTLNFIREVEEVNRYNELTGELYDGIIEYSNMGYNFFKNNILEDEMKSLSNSRNKILNLRKKYFK